MERLRREEILEVLRTANLKEKVESLEKEVNAMYPSEYRKNKHKADRGKRSIEQFFSGLVANAVHSAQIVGDAISSAVPELVVAEKVGNLLENLLANAVYDYGKQKLFPEEDGARINIGPRGPAREPVNPVPYHTFSNDDWKGLLANQRLVALHVKDVAKMLGIEFVEPDIIHEYVDKEQFVNDISSSQVAMENWLQDMQGKLEFLNKHSN